MTMTEHSHVYLLRAEYDQMTRGLDEVNSKFAALEKRTEAAEAKVKQLNEAKKKATAESKRLAAQVTDTRKVLAGFAGQVGSTGARVVNLTQGLAGLGGTAGIAGLAVIALTAGAIGAAKGAFMLADAAVAAEKRIHHLALVTDEQRVAVQSMDEAHRGMNRQIDATTVKIGAALAPEIVSLMNMMTGLAIATGIAAEEIDKFVDGAPEEEAAPVGWGTAAYAVISRLAGTNVLLAALAPTIDETTESLEELGAAANYEDQGPIQDPMYDLAQALAAAAKAGRDAKDAAAELKREQLESVRIAKAGADAFKEIAEAEEALGDIALEAGSDMASAADLSIRAYDERLEKVQKLLDEHLITEEQAAVAIVAINERAARDSANIWIESQGAILDAAIEKNKRIAEIHDEVRISAVNSAFDMAQSVIEIFQNEIESHMEALEEQQARLQEINENRREEFQEDQDRHQQRIDSIQEYLNETQGLSAAERAAKVAEIEGIEAAMDAREADHKADQKQRRLRVKAKEEEIQKSQNQIKALFRMSQAAAISGIIFNAAEAYAAMLLTFAALGPGAPAAAAAVVVPAAAAQTAAVLAQKPPKFHDGTLAPDEVMGPNSVLRNGEATVVFNERAVQDGAVEDAMARNRGEAGSVGGNVIFGNFGRVVGRAVLDELGRPSSELSRALGSPVGITAVYGRA